MNIFTSGYESITALTNVFIFIASLICFIKIEKLNINKLWTAFFFFLFLAGLLGSIIHGIKFSEQTIEILWFILSFIFALVINTLVVIFLDIKNKKILIISLLTIFLYSILFIETMLKIDFMLTFIIYSCIGLIVCLYKSIKSSFNLNYFIALISQFIGGVFLLVEKIKIPFLLLDKNGIYHLFVLITILFFYKEIKNDN